MTAEREWDAATYHRVSEPHVAWGDKVLARLELRGDETVVDAGCGTGRVTVSLAERVPQGRVIGVDRSVAMATAAAATLSGRATVVVADLLTLPLAAGSVDAVFSTATFHWIADHAALFAELARVLRVGGRLEAQCGGGANLARARAIAAEVAASPRFVARFEGWEDTRRYAWPEETAARLRDAGFESPRVWLESARTSFDSAEACAEFMGACILRPWFHRLAGEEERREFAAAVVDGVGTADPRWTLDYWRLNIEAERA